jgi:hypothetical protein
MKGAFSFIALVIIFLGTGSVSMEVFKCSKAISYVYGSVYSIASDAVETSMIDECRSDGISLIDGIYAREYLVESIRSRFGLDHEFVRSDGEGMVKGLRIKELDVEEGEYETSGDRAVMVKDPCIRLSMDVQIECVILNSERIVEIPLEIIVKNSRIG